MQTRIVVFEDDEIIRALLTKFLSKRGHEVLSYPGPGLCPLQNLPKCPCPPDHVCADFIVSDVVMPDMSGLEFIENQLKKGCKVKNIALMSGTWADLEWIYAIRLNCKIFHKPFILKEIDNWIKGCEKNIDPNRILYNWY